MLVRALYSSVSTHNRGHRSDLDVLRTAEAFNAENAITGFLFRAPRSFIQVLEGDDGVIDPLLERIKRDGRHGTFSVQLYEPCVGRAFKQWSMGYGDITEQRAAYIRRMIETNIAAGNAAISELATLAEEFQ